MIGEINYFLDVTMIFKRSIKLLFLPCLLLLAGCANIDNPEPVIPFKVETPAHRQAQLAKVTNWRVEGAFSLIESGQKPEIANYIWQEYSRKNYRINISSALGLYQVDIHYQFHTVKLWKNGAQVFTAKTPEILMQKALGWSLPVTQLRYWIKGMPAKNAGRYVARYDAYGHLVMLSQDGWIINFSKYKTKENNIDLPGVITMQRPGFFVKIIETDWYWFMEPYKLPVIK